MTPPETPDAETVTALLEDCYECTCGNTPDYFGFIPCTPDGVALDTENDAEYRTWDGKHLLCNRCGRIIDQDTYDATTGTVAVVGRTNAGPTSPAGTALPTKAFGDLAPLDTYRIDDGEPLMTLWTKQPSRGDEATHLAIVARPLDGGYDVHAVVHRDTHVQVIPAD